MKIEKVNENQIRCTLSKKDLAERQKEFQTLHNELRILLGKEPRKYLEVDNETNN